MLAMLPMMMLAGGTGFGRLGGWEKKLRPWTVPKSSFASEGAKRQFRARLGELFERCEGDMRRRCRGLEAFEDAKKQFRKAVKVKCGGKKKNAAMDGAKKEFRTRLREFLEGSEGEMRRRNLFRKP